MSSKSEVDSELYYRPDTCIDVSIQDIHLHLVVRACTPPGLSNVRDMSYYPLEVGWPGRRILTMSASTHILFVAIVVQRVTSSPAALFSFGSVSYYMLRAWMQQKDLLLLLYGSCSACRHEALQTSECMNAGLGLYCLDPPATTHVRGSSANVELSGWLSGHSTLIQELVWCSPRASNPILASLFEIRCS